MDLDEGLVKVSGKTGPRVVPIGATTVRALDRHMRARAKRYDAAGPALWLGRALSPGDRMDEGKR